MLDTAIILAGGEGARLRPLTEKTPKPLLPIKNKPILQHIIENLKKHNITNIILSLGYKARQIQDYFQDGKRFGLTISYCLENGPLGTGGAVQQAAQALSQPFFLLWGDNLMNLNLQALHQSFLQNQTPITMVLTPREDVENFGVAKLEGNKILFFVEKPKREDAPSNLINAGAFILHPDCLKVLPEGKSSLEKDCFEKLAPQGKLSFYLHPGQWLPTDTLEKYRHAEQYFNPQP